jgi:hypothetical protein
MEMTDTQLIQSVMKMQEELVSAIADVNRVMEDMVKNQQPSTHLTSKPFFPSSGEEREQVMRSLFNLQRSGITNMMSADDYIQKRFGFTKSKSEDYLFYYIDNYAELEQQYSKPNGESIDGSSVSTAAPKKRKGPKPYAEMTPEELAEAKVRAQARAKAKAEVVSIVEAPTEAPTIKKKTVIRLKKSDTQEPKPKGVLIWNAFMNMVKDDMMRSSNGVEPSYNDIMKKAQELKDSDPVSYKLFADNCTT